MKFPNASYGGGRSVPGLIQTSHCAHPTHLRTAKPRKPMTVLIVDDNGTNLKLLRAVLERQGHCVLTANDGLEALAVLERQPIDAIISDILMPNMDGYRFCYEVRTSSRFCSLPFIVYTSSYTTPRDEKLS